jgi:hypothetical protein
LIFYSCEKIATALRQIRQPGIEIVATIRLWLVAPVVLLEIDCPLPEGNLTVSFWKPMTAVGRIRTTRKQKFAHCEWLLWYDFNGIYE